MKSADGSFPEAEWAREACLEMEVEVEGYVLFPASNLRLLGDAEERRRFPSGSGPRRTWSSQGEREWWGTRNLGWPST